MYTELTATFAVDSVAFVIRTMTAMTIDVISPRYEASGKRAARLSSRTSLYEMTWAEGPAKKKVHVKLMDTKGTTNDRRTSVKTLNRASPSF